VPDSSASKRHPAPAPGASPANHEATSYPHRTVTLSCSVPMSDVQFGASVTLPLEQADEAAIDAALDVLEAAAVQIHARGEAASSRGALAPPAGPDTPQVMPFDWRDPLSGIVYERGLSFAAVPTAALRRLYPLLRYETPRRAVALTLQQRGEPVLP
jgi:hypothetical protein